MNLHDDLMHIQTAALQAVDPAAAVQRSLSLEGSTLVAGDRSWSLARMHRVFLIGVGKASVRWLRPLPGPWDPI
jgi:glycerate-2-kinase